MLYAFAFQFTIVGLFLKFLLTVVSISDQNFFAVVREMHIFSGTPDYIRAIRIDKNDDSPTENDLNKKT